jgi:AraC-like DNA-binding protein
MRSVFFDIKPEYLTSLLLEQEPKKGTALHDVRENVAANQFAEAGADIVTPTFHSIIEGIFNCPLQGTLGNLMLEGALQQLLAIQFAMMGNEMPVRKSIAIRDRNIITAVKDHLDTTFNEDHSLVSLSKKFGINQNKLKTQFRELFGVPVIGYLYDRKMEHARTLLLDKGMFVNEVASLVGYRNPNHFATAFKRKFGINPSKLKG